LIAAALGLLPACGSDDDKKDSGSGGSATQPTKVDVGVTETGKKALLKVPKSVKAGPVELSFENTGKKPHDVQLVRVAGDQTFAEVLEVVESEGAPTPKWLSFGGGIGSVQPGKTSSATAVLAPGRYFVADTESDGKEAAEFEVTGEEAPGELAPTSAKIETVDYGFKLSGLKAGTNEITFENTGAEPHHVIAAPIAKGATFADVKKFAMSEEEPSGPPPVDFDKTTTTTVIDGGGKQTTQVELQKGKYAFLCFISDRKGGPPHVAKGMVQEVTIE